MYSELSQTVLVVIVIDFSLDTGRYTWGSTFICTLAIHVTYLRATVAFVFRKQRKENIVKQSGHCSVSLHTQLPAETTIILTAFPLFTLYQ